MEVRSGSNREFSARYLEYLKSEKWKAKRAERIAIAQGHCAICSRDKAIDVHHLTYERIGNEEMEDLLPLCRYHHDIAERLKTEGKLPTEGNRLHLLVETVRQVLVVAVKRKTDRRFILNRRRVDKIFVKGNGFASPKRKWD